MTGHFPITGYRIRTFRAKPKTTKAPFRLPHHPHTFDLRDVAKPKCFQRGEVEPSNGIGQMRQGMEPASPYSSASGIAPTPSPSITSTMIRVIMGAL